MRRPFLLAALLSAMLPAALPAEAFDLDALDSFVPALLRKRGGAGLQLCIEAEGRILCRSYGVQDMDKTPVEDGTLFLGGGLLRPLAALAVNRSQELSFEGRTIRMRDLLSESAGFAPVGHLAPPGRALPVLEKEIRIALRPGVPSPGAANWYLIARESQKKTGEPFLEQVNKQIQALGGNSRIAGGEIELGGGKRADGVTVAGYKLFSTPAPRTSLPELDGFWTSAQAYQNVLRRLPASSFELLARNPDAGPGTGGAAAGLELLEDPCVPGIFARVQGERGSFVSLAAVRPGAWSMVLLANSGGPHSLRELFHFVRKWVFPGRCGYYSRTIPAAPDIEGDYRPLDGANPGIGTSFFQDLRIEASSEGPVLAAMFDAGASAELVPLEDGSYLVRGGAAMDGWKLTFQRENDKVTGFVSERGSYKRIPALFSMRGYPVLAAILLFMFLAGLIVFLIRNRRVK